MLILDYIILYSKSCGKETSIADFIYQSHVNIAMALKLVLVYDSVCVCSESTQGGGIKRGPENRNI
jgi:hypothetical protein